MNFPQLPNLLSSKGTFLQEFSTKELFSILNLINDVKEKKRAVHTEELSVWSVNSHYEHAYEIECTRKSSAYQQLQFSFYYPPASCLGQKEAW